MELKDEKRNTFVKERSWGKAPHIDSRNSHPGKGEEEGKILPSRTPPGDTIGKGARSSPKPDSSEIKEIVKLLPPIGEWPKFSGEGEYDHINFIKYRSHNRGLWITRRHCHHEATKTV